MNILIGCEESQTVCIAFREKGHEAYSCDILPCSGGHPEWHIQDDVLKHLNDGWDMIISFQPCTDLAVSGATWFERKRLSGEQEQSIKFFFEVWRYSNCSENPVGILNGGRYIKKWFPILYYYMKELGFPFKPTQIINPYQFGDPVSKQTCLWLRDLPLLLPTQIVEKSKYIQAPSGRKYPEWCWNTGGGSGKLRSKTFPGIARAMAEQWSNITALPCAESIAGMPKSGLHFA